MSMRDYDMSMSVTIEFAVFIQKIRSGDDQAAQELVKRYEPVIRRAVRMQLRDPRLYSQFDWTDICQSVMGCFFARAGAGEYDLKEPGQLRGLLLAMTRHKVAQQERRHRAARRDYRRREACDPAYLAASSAADPSPSRIIAGRELLDEIRRRMSSEEWMLADLRAQGCEWAEIAGQLGGTPEARRKQLARALDRVEQQFKGRGKDLD
jgi:RNA polymerase sigma-70 factor (ECF subfamily)